MIKTVMFDLGGVIFTLDQQEAIRRLNNLGIADAAQRLDPYQQGGIFGELESGAISADTFREELSKLAGHTLTYEECRHAWLGYVSEVPARNLELLRQLRSKGYRLLLLSNTNPYMMSWVNSPDFDGNGHPLSSYLDKLYLSYEMKLMKPAESIFRQVLMSEQCFPNEILFVDDSPRNVAVASQIGIKTFCPENGKDWTKEIFSYL
ncbi:MAG: HAD family phosphatase [Prevotella sp.]|nr:HAD family phosphatase [Prevotella sp.]